MSTATMNPASTDTIDQQGIPVLVDISDTGNVYIDEELNNGRYLTEDADIREERDGELAASIESVGGLLQSIAVMKTDPSRKTEHNKPYELVMGFRRCRALKKVAESTGIESYLKNVPALVREYVPEHQRVLHQLIENVVRQNLSPVEIGDLLKSLVASGSLTQKQVSESIGMPQPTVSYHIKVANLCTEIKEMVHRDFYSDKVKGDKLPTLSFSAARKIAELNLPKEQQVEAAKIGSVKTYGEFCKYLEQTYGKTDAAKDEAAAAPGTEDAAADSGSQRTGPKTRRAEELKNKYIPYFQQRRDAAERKDKPIWDARLDAVNWVLQNDGTTLAAELSPWEQEMEAKAKEEEAHKEETRLRDDWIKKAVSWINKKLAEMPPVDAPNRAELVFTLPQCLTLVRADLVNTVTKGKEAGKPAGYNLINSVSGPGSFKVGTTESEIDAFMELVSKSWHENKAHRDKMKAAADAARQKKKEDAENATKANAVGDGSATQETITAETVAV